MTVESTSVDSLRRISQASMVLACLATAGALYLGQQFLVPIAFAILFASLLEPVVRLLRRTRLPAPLAATIVMLASAAILIAAGFALQKPMTDLMSDLPKSIAKARAKLTKMSAPLARVGITPFGPQQRAPARTAPPSTPPRTVPDSTKRADSGASARVQPLPPAATDTGSRPDSSATKTTSSSPQRAGAQSGRSGTTAPPDVTAAAGQAFGATLSLLAEVVAVLLLTLLLLAGGDTWAKKIEDVIGSPEQHVRTREAANKMRRVVTRYMVVNALINLGQAVLVTGVAWWVGLPSPVLWGVLTFIAEFIPYLGGAAMIVLLTLAGLGVSDSVLHALIAPVAYLVITTLQNNVVSPVAYGRGLRLNAAMILVSVMLWYMLWGIGGVFLALPIMASVRILSEYVDLLRPVGVLLEE